MPVRRINIHPDSKVLAAAAAARLITRLVDMQNQRGEATVALTGGVMVNATLNAVANSPACRAVNWSKVNFWWGDERFLAPEDPQRHDIQADQALLNHIDVEPGRVHRAGSPVEFPDADSAAAHYAHRLAEAAEKEFALEERDDGVPGQVPAVPRIDVLLLGLGPDAHVASLFPEMSAVRTVDRTVVGVSDFPTPPPTRISLTRPALSSATEAWIIAAGDDKAAAVGLALAGANPVQVPAAGVAGTDYTLWLIDQDAAAKVSQNLILPALW
jgi:6-phosphogluconolactonase